MTQRGTNAIDRNDERGAHAAARLENDLIGWLTTVAPDGTPQTSPIWFLWDGETFLIYSLESARIRNVEQHARVSLNLDGNGLGGDIVVIEADAAIDRTAPAADENPAYLAKYQPVMDGYGWTPQWFAGRYSMPLRLTPTKYRYW